MSDWWSKKLGTAPQALPPASTPPPAPAPAPRTDAQHQAAQSGLHVRPDAQAAPQSVEEGADRLFDPNAYANIRRKSVEAGNTGTCPECGSGNYFDNIRSNSRSTAGKPSSPRCYDCGFPITHGLNA